MTLVDTPSAPGPAKDKTGSLEAPLIPFVRGAVWSIVGVGNEGAPERVETVISRRRLQQVVDYRGAIRSWFDRLVIGGHLIVTVPHAFLHDRRFALPSPWDTSQRRLYTPALLAQEVEEALPANAYRVRWLGDLDAGYDYTLGPDLPPEGDCEVAIVLERITPPAWSPLTATEALPGGEHERPSEPPFSFEPIRSRIEINTRPHIARILVLKLDHLGDLIMGLPALERLRTTFPEAHITLVVGTWNAAMAAELKVADRVVAFDAFPRNSSEEEPNVEATLGVFRPLMSEEYDLAIDLRSDTDTRTLLRAVRAPLKAGIGTRARFPFLDIALPLDSTRNEAERAQQDRLDFFTFSSQESADRRHFGIRSHAGKVERDCAIVWGPYRELEPGDYIFDFYLDLEDDRHGGLINLDVALNGRVVAQMPVSQPQNFHLPFRVERPGSRFEARIWAVDGRRSIDFTFYGGVLIKRASRSVLHQSEYLALLVELIAIRTKVSGLLTDVSAP